MCYLCVWQEPRADVKCHTMELYNKQKILKTKRHSGMRHILHENPMGTEYKLVCEMQMHTARGI